MSACCLGHTYPAGTCIAQVAGQQSGVNVVDKAQSAVNTLKIINALNEISDILKVILPAPSLQSFASSSHHPTMLSRFGAPHSLLLTAF